MKINEIKTYNDLKKLYASKGYIFREYKYALNLGAIRAKTSESDKFDDLGWCAWVDEIGPQVLFFWLTTDPGKYWLQNPMNSDGCAIMVPNQYKEVLGAGKHKNEYEAFVQVGTMAYVRDNNRDTKLDFSLYRDPEKRKSYLFWGIIGSNLHRAHMTLIMQLIGRYSAACQVVQRPETFKKLIELRDKSLQAGFKRWDYTLFEEL